MQIMRTQKGFVKFWNKKFRMSWFVCSKWYIIVSRCLEVYKLDPAKFLSVPGLAWQTVLKMIKVKLDLLTDIDVINCRKKY